MNALDGKVALITGASRGIGAAAAKLFVERGAKVLLCDVRDEAGEEVAATLGDSAAYAHLDVTSESDWQGAVKTGTSRFGRLNVLVNNAGISELGPLTEMSGERYMKTLEINQLGVFLGMKSVVQAMGEAGGGSIINSSSTMGLTAAPGSIAYAASKWAVRGMTKVAALELGPLKIRVNSIHPGLILTPMVTDAGITPEQANGAAAATPLGRIGQPEEVAKLMAYLASEESSYSTGSEFTTDGGATAGG